MGSLASMTQETHYNQPVETAEADEISLADIFAKLVKQRGVLIAAVVLVGLITASCLFYARLMLPSAEYVEQPFELSFDGVLQQRYPNGQRFNYADIVDMSILKEVYSANKLESYLTLEDFGRAVVITEINDEMELIRKEYKAELSSNKLSTVDRSEIERAFSERMNSLKKPLFRLRWHGEKAAEIPRPILEKALADVLAEWAKDAIERKGAFRLGGGLLSPAILKTPIFESKEDALMRIDAYRQIIDKAALQLAALKSLPGALQMRLPNDISLEEVAMQLQTIKTFRFPMLKEYARLFGQDEDVKMNRFYAETRLESIRLNEKLLLDQGQVLQDAWDSQALMSSSHRMMGGGALGTEVDPSYALRGSVDGAMMDKIAGLVEEAGQTKYRQKLLNRIIEHGYLVASLKKEKLFYEQYASKGGSEFVEGSENTISRFNDQMKLTSDAMSSLLQDMQDIHAQISESQLTRGGVLYSLNGPVLYEKTYLLTIKKMLMVLVASCLLAAGLASVYVLIKPASQK